MRLSYKNVPVSPTPTKTLYFKPEWVGRTLKNWHTRLYVSLEGNVFLGDPFRRSPNPFLLSCNSYQLTGLSTDTWSNLRDTSFIVSIFHFLRKGTPGYNLRCVFATDSCRVTRLPVRGVKTYPESWESRLGEPSTGIPFVLVVSTTPLRTELLLWRKQWSSALSGLLRICGPRWNPSRPKGTQSTRKSGPFSFHREVNINVWTLRSPGRWLHPGHSLLFNPYLITLWRCRIAGWPTRIIGLNRFPKFRKVYHVSCASCRVPVTGTYRCGTRKSDGFNNGQWRKPRTWPE